MTYLEITLTFSSEQTATTAYQLVKHWELVYPLDDAAMGEWVHNHCTIRMACEISGTDKEEGILDELETDIRGELSSYLEAAGYVAKH